MVVAEVHLDDRRVGLKFFCQLFSSNKGVARLLKKAHKWADDRIKICEEGEVIDE